jgi:two-component system sensor histidine kinase YesM
MVLREKESELDALQAQINPHFLYNALDSLYWQATDAGQEELAENILAMSELFRQVLSSGQSEITVRQEIGLVQNYLHIQKMRFSQKLDYSISVSEKMMGHTISKLIIQPFVENAIVHGLERLDSWGGVQVRGDMRDGMLHFVVEDNGAGLSRETVEEILFASEDGRYANQRVGHYAIRNVKERMALRYGDAARLDIQSAPGKGTRVSIIIPAVLPEDARHEEAFDEP